MQGKDNFKCNNYDHKNKSDFRYKHNSCENNNSKPNSSSPFVDQTKEKSKKNQI